MTEAQALEMVRLKKLRMVSPVRKRKLRKKGVHVRWLPVLDSYVWFPSIVGWAGSLAHR